MSKLVSLFEEKEFVLLVSPPRNDPELAQAAFYAGADAIKVHVNVHHRASGNHFGTWAEEEPVIRTIVARAPGPVGIMPGAGPVATPAEMKAAAEAGIDFFDIYDAHMPAWMLAVPMARMVAVGHEWLREGVEALADLGMDVLEASVIHPDCYGQPLTVRDLEDYRVLVRSTPKPVIVPSQKALVPSDLVMLRRAGVRGVLLGTISIGDTAASFSERLPAFVKAL